MNEFIITDPHIRFGTPTIKGTRICVEDIMAFINSGMTKAEIIADFPELTDKMIEACQNFDFEKSLNK